MKTINQRGVTLMELLTVILILGILAAIAFPSYRTYLIRAQRAEAKTALLQLQAAQEKFYLNGNTYSDSVTDVPPDGLGLPGVSESGKYDITVALVDDGQGYTATATPAAGGGQEDDALCPSFSISDSGTRSLTADPADTEDADDVRECWR